MKKILSLTLAALLLVGTLAGCSDNAKPTPTPGGSTGAADPTPAPAELTAAERVELYKSAITGARDDELNEIYPFWTADDETGLLFMEMMGLSEDMVDCYVLSASQKSVKAYTIAVVYPAAGKTDAVTQSLQGYIDQQKQSFEQYLADQYEVAKAAKLETLADGTVLLVMCEDQDQIFSGIKTAIENGQ